MKIITSIHVYNFHLIVSYLGQGVQIIKFDDLRNKFKQVKKEYLKEVSEKQPLLELTTFDNQLFGIYDFKVKSFSLNQPFQQSDYSSFWREFKSTQLSRDNDNLFLLSEESGIQEVNIQNPIKPYKLKNIVPKTFEKLGNPTVSNMISKGNSIYLSYRGYGASKIDNYSAKAANETEYRSEDAQDVNYLHKQDLIVIADGIDGLLFFNPKETKPLSKIKLDMEDFPQQINLYEGNILIKGKNGLYIYYVQNRRLRKIWDGTIGVLTTYYNYIFFSSKGQINLLCSSENTISYFQLHNLDRMDIKINRYSE